MHASFSCCKHTNVGSGSLFCTFFFFFFFFVVFFSRDVKLTPKMHRNVTLCVCGISRPSVATDYLKIQVIVEQFVGEDRKYEISFQP